MQSSSDIRLGVCILTYNRRKYAEPTIRSLLEHLVWPGSLYVHIADDGSPPGYAEDLQAIAGGYENVARTSRSDSHRRGYGANYNLATQVMHPSCDMILMVEDDWVTRGPLRISHHVRALIQFGSRIECIRLGYLGFTQSLKGEVLYVDGTHYLLLDPFSDEPHVFAGHPRLETVAFQRRAEPWPEGLSPGETEFRVSTRPSNRVGIAWPMDLNPSEGAFDHIGTERAS